MPPLVRPENKNVNEKEPQIANINFQTDISSNIIQIKFKNFITKALVDTGASISCISHALLNKLFQSQNHKKVQLQNSKVTHARGVGGDLLKISGEVDLQLQIADKPFTQKFYVFERLHQSIILGVDFLEKNGCTICYKTKTLQSNVGLPIVSLVDLPPSASFNVGLARAISDITIPPLHATLIPVKLSRVPNNVAVLLEPVDSLSNKYCLAGARATVIPQKGITFMKILNPMSTPATIKSKQVLGKLFPLESLKTFDESDTPQVNSVHPQKNLSDAEYIKIAKDLEISLDNCALSDAQKQKLLIFLGKNHDVFASSSSDIGCTNVYQHRIETGNHTPHRQKPYRQSPEGQARIDEHVNQMLQDGVIVESESTWAAPIVLCKKKDSSYRFAIDFRGLNAKTEAIHFPIPDLQDALDSVGTNHSKIFSVMDFKSAFWQIPLDPETAHKTTFVTHNNAYQFKRMPYGIMNGSMAFQMCISRVLQGINFKYALVFIDDILCHSSSLDLHFHHLSSIFDRLRNANLKLNPKKCQFAAPKVDYLGHILSDKGIQANPNTVKAVREYPRPKNRKGVRGFLGLCNFYRRYIKNFSHIAAPLNRLLKQNTRLKWTPECNDAFNTLKDKLTSSPVLAFPDLNRPFRLATDASGHAIGYILSQINQNGEEHVIAYGGRSLRGTENNWSVTEREGLALVEAIKQYHPYLTNNHFEVFTDHISLKWLQKIKLATGRLARWSLLLQAYDFTITHRPGVTNQNADSLSRREYDGVQTPAPNIHDDDEDEIIATVQTPLSSNGTDASTLTNTDQMSAKLLPNSPTVQKSSSNQFTSSTSDKGTYVVHLEYPDPSQVTPSLNKVVLEQEDPIIVPQSPPSVEKELPASLHYLQWQCPDLRPILEFKVNSVLPANETEAKKLAAVAEQYVIQNDVLYHFLPVRSKNVPKNMRYQKQLAVPTTLREDILKSYHDGQGGSHFGFDKTYAAIKLKYYWPNMYANIERYIKSCDPCQRASRHYNQKKAPLQPLPVSEPFSRLHMDILGPLTPTPENYKYLLLVVDSCTGWIEGWPMVNQDADTVAKILFKEIICRYGAPDCIVSDCGANFLSATVQSLCEFFKITRHTTTAYHPACNGRVEVMNSSIAKSLRAYCAEQQHEWASYLPGILLGLRQTVNSSTGYPPYTLLFGRIIRLPVDCALMPKDSAPKNVKMYMKEIQEQMQTSLEIAKQNTTQAKQTQKHYHDKSAAIPKFRVGDKVLLKNYRTKKGLSKKLSPKFTGPYQIHQYGPNYTYKLKRLSDNKILPRFTNNENIKSYIESYTDNSNKQNGEPTEQQANMPKPKPKSTGNHATSTHPRPAPTGNKPSSKNAPKHAVSLGKGSGSKQSPNNQQNSISNDKTDETEHSFERIILGKKIRGQHMYKVKWSSGGTSFVHESDINPNYLHDYLKTHTRTGAKRKANKGKLKYFK